MILQKWPTRVNPSCQLVCVIRNTGLTRDFFIYKIAFYVLISIRTALIMGGGGSKIYIHLRNKPI